MKAYAMTYRAANGKRETQHLLAADIDAAWNQAFDLAERMAGQVGGFCVAPLRVGA